MRVALVGFLLAAVLAPAAPPRGTSFPGCCCPAGTRMDCCPVETEAACFLSACGSSGNAAATARRPAAPRIAASGFGIDRTLVPATPALAPPAAAVAAGFARVDDHPPRSS